MKRLNSETGMPFKYGDIRHDGYVFVQYRSSKKLKRNGFVPELWCNSIVFNSIKNKHKTCLAKHNTTSEGRAKQLLFAAKKRGTVSVSLNWVIEKLEKGFCELSGLPFDLSTSKNFFHNPYSPSLDKIDPNIKEYSVENTRVVLTCINQALNQYGLEHFLKVAQAVIDKQKEK